MRPALDRNAWGCARRALYTSRCVENTAIATSAIDGISTADPMPCNRSTSATQATGKTRPLWRTQLFENRLSVVRPMTTHASSTARTTNLEIARAAYDAYVTKDRAALEALIADDFISRARSTIVSIGRRTSCAAGRTAR